MRSSSHRLVAAVLALMLYTTTASAQPHYAEQSGWRFDNFKDAAFPWETYRDSFIGIPPTRDPLSSGFDVLFYDNLYKSELSKEGNCYGMSLLSLMIVKHGGHLGYCLPLQQYSGDVTGSPSTGPSDPGLRRAVNIMHGHQVNLPTLQHILEIIGKSKNRDGAYAFERFEFYQMKNDPTLVSVTKSVNPADGGHTMVAYRSQDLGGGNRRIYVYDPNRSWADSADRTWYQNGDNYITISGHSWSFVMAGTLGTWSGDPASGGNLMITPISVTGPHSRSPASMGDQIIGQILTAIFISGADAEIEQVTDGQGRRLFVPGTLEVDTNPITGMGRMLPWYPSDQAAPGKATPILFHLGNSGSALEVTVKSGGAGYRLRALGPRGFMLLSARGGRGSERVTLQHVGTEEPRVGLSNERGTTEYDVQFAQVVAPRQRTHVLRANRLRLAPGESAELAVRDRSRALLIDSPGAVIEYDLELRAVTRAGQEILSRAGAAQNAGEARLVRPRAWEDLKSGDVLFRPAAGPPRRSVSPQLPRPQ